MSTKTHIRCLWAAILVLAVLLASSWIWPADTFSTITVQEIVVKNTEGDVVARLGPVHSNQGAVLQMYDGIAEGPRIELTADYFGSNFRFRTGSGLYENELYIGHLEGKTGFGIFYGGDHILTLGNIGAQPYIWVDDLGQYRLDIDDETLNLESLLR